MTARKHTWERRTTILLAGMCCVASMLASCECGSRPADTDESEAARAAVERLFTALEDGDCQTMVELLVTVDSLESCDEELGRLAGGGLSLERVIEVKRDGRDRNSYIVTVDVSGGGQGRRIQVRATKRADRWTLLM